MELRSKRVCIMSLPGGDRRGTSGADAGCHSLRTVGGEELSRRALAGDKPEVTTADQIDETSHHASNSPISSIVSSSSSFRYSPTSSSTCSMQSEDVVQTANYANGSVPTTDSSKTRRKWSTEMNEFILRNYLQITKLETDTKVYLLPLHEKFIDRFPDMKDVTRQRVGDQRRAIIRKKLLPQSTIDHIYNEVKAELQNTQPQINQYTQSRTSTLNIERTANTNTPKSRMRWTTEHNETIIRAYYKITELETNQTAYRQLLHQNFIDTFPSLAHLSEQRIADQRRLIIANKYIHRDRLDMIKKEVAEELKLTCSSQSQDVNVLDSNLLSSQSSPQIDVHSPNTVLTMRTDTQPEITPFSWTHRLQTHHTLEINNTDDPIDQVSESNLERELVQKLRDTLEMYSDINPETRPRLPRLRENKYLYKLISLFNNKILPKFLNDNATMLEIHTLIYCTATVISKQLGYKIQQDTEIQRNQTKPDKQPWQIRLEKDIAALRVDIGRLTQYINNNNRSNKIVREVKLILSKNKIHSSHEGNNNTPQDVLDTLKQKLALKAHRLARYLKALRRKNDNKLFTTNEKGFYRQLGKSGNIDYDSNEQAALPDKEELKNYWADLWEHQKSHNEEAKWIKEEETRWGDIEEMEFEDLTKEDIETVTKKMKNWKAAGVDGVHNFWFKKLAFLHEIIAKKCTELIKGEENLPDFVTKGITHMLPKSSDTANPSQYRPITCLPTLYKLITSCITMRMNSHIEANNILAEEQKGCRQSHKGCKEQLIIDSTILKHANKHNRNLHLTYIDYKKAFDSVPHSWLIRVLQIYKINPTVITFLEDAMTKWKTTLSLTTKFTKIVTEEIYIGNGIFQGDSLSPLWFCLALNPLSYLLNQTRNGYKLTHNATISHLLYMDDIKLYGKSSTDMENLLNITAKFSKDIQMTFGLDKCKTLHIHKGKFLSGDYSINDDINITAMDINDTYKYLGIKQNKHINHTQIKQDLKTEYLRRVNLICRKHLNSKNLFKALNTYAIPVLTYSFAVIKWTNSDINNLQIKTRTSLTKHKYLHPKSAIERMTIKREKGGREKLNTWRLKQLHGRHIHDIEQPHIDSIASNKWLKLGYLYPETEGFLISIQDQVVNTKNYRKYIIKDPNALDDRCRKCHRNSETIQHIINACPVLTQNDYTHRHNQVAHYIHQKLAIKYKLLPPKVEPYYQYTPKSVLESPNCRIYFDRAILTDKTIYCNRPDITVLDKLNKTVYFIDVAIPNTHNIKKTISDKIHKYSELKEEVLRIWNLDKVYIVPLVLSSTGVIPKHLHRSIQLLDLPEHTYITMQKAAILNTCRIVRRFLQDEPAITADSLNN
ncbi:hypothetical protein ABMA28_000587 [Loxostege sticticalis]|uniref:Reverse transcriptase domain-containing protein n=1 Tax=Loxostege sticticalis TaxID=481309 RepID=A0ABD0TSQ2_LOXSC